MLFGAVAGLAGYFFFGSQEGKTARARLISEWERAKGALVDEGVLTPDQADQSLPELIEHTLHTIVEPPKKRAAQRHELQKPVKRKPQRFRGV